MIEIEKFEEKRIEIENIRKTKLQGFIISSNVKRIDREEKVRHYFCNLENRDFLSKGMAQLKLDNRSIIENKNIF